MSMSMRMSGERWGVLCPKRFYQKVSVCSQMLLKFNQTSINEEGSPLRPYRLANGPFVHE